MPAESPRPARRVLGELLAAALWPVHLGVTVFPLTLPPAAVVTAEVERMRAGWCGAGSEPGHRVVGSWSAWARGRLRSAAVWRVDLPLTVVSLLCGLVSLTVGGLGAVAGIVLLLAPWLHRLGQDPVVGPWTADSAASAWAMVPAGVLVIALTLGLWIGVSLLRDAVVRALDGADGARLRAELDAVRRNRTQVMAGFDAERRRIERDLHDGAQQELVGLSITLGLLEHAVSGLEGPPAERARDLGRRAHDQAEHALVRLRETVRGIHPRELTDQGTAAALRSLAERSPLPVRVEIGAVPELPEQVGAALYFVAAEALTNVARHSGAGSATLELGCVPTGTAETRTSGSGRSGSDRSGSGRSGSGAATAGKAGSRTAAADRAAQVWVRVVDDGRGGAALGAAGDRARASSGDREKRGGTGLAGLAERLEALGGSLEVDSPPGGGTRVTARLPVTEQVSAHGQVPIPEQVTVTREEEARSVAITTSGVASLPEEDTTGTDAAPESPGPGPRGLG